MYRLLALDLDGTLLRHDQRVDDKDLAAIRELQNAGVTVTIVTGRLLGGSLGAARACAIEGAIACVEGSHLVDLATSETLVHHAIGPALASTLRTAFVDHGLASFVFDADGIHHDDTGADYAHYVSTWSPHLRVVEQARAWETAPLAAVAIGDEAAVRAAADTLRSHAEHLFSVQFAVSAVPGKYCVLARAAGTSKGTALAELCARVGITTDQAVAVGDWMNDVPMFEVAGRSFVMDGAPPAVVAAASDRLVTLAGAGGGIAEAVRRAWG